ncbi:MULTISPECIES: hypothetical protein [Providencia]|uniref:hypothetical protein n=1 Tax=Providencia TaxID=586 RepID=UPI001CC3AA04|nr:hypothetical protein [Providencia alcalifaciens]CAG9414187.1 hypothetical protein NVI2019_PLFLNFOB_01107 [Providencia alcalifaciens]CAG9422779.1 hypothetical protein NVI2019_OHEONHNH_02214 [Providencia alcalifaciens]CAG9426799.1 hypothetical protein NVI2019_KOLGMIGM_02710 [Providencia alcalifaciens]CAG9427831.1 hypothetical protein NVI2019_OGMBKCAO_02710 [Providencia alcalifaciens]CAG9428073.1 hypothetical protein NVI2019_ANGEOOBF_02709 [Providencia alcalifaciens]
MNKLLACFLSVSILSSAGCVTAAVWDSNTAKETNIRECVDLKDNIVSAFEYKDISVKNKLTNQKLKEIELPTSGYGFLGDKYIYILTNGSAELMKLNELVKVIPLSAFNNPEGVIRIEIKPDERREGLVKFNDSYFVYIDKKYRLSPEQEKSLKDFGFSERRFDNDKSWVKTIPLSGYLFDRNGITLPLVPNAKLNQSYKVEFYTTEEYTSLSAGKLAGNVMITPFTIAADIIATPILLILYANYVNK